MTEQLSKEELDERVAILRRFRTLLEQQRTKFREYLNVLELQESKISAEDADALIAHSELEAQIVAGIGSLQKVIVPMQKLYQSSKAATYNPQDAQPVDELQNDLTKLQEQVLQQNEKNRALLRSHIVEIRKQMVELKNPYRNHNSIYAEKVKTGSLVEINA
jgi:hypothetical protein